MFELQRENVVRIVATEYERDKLLKEGFQLRESESKENEKPIDEMKVDELKEFAKQREIDLDGATQKADILAKIQAALEENHGS